ncbi:MAG: YjfB family protein [Devosia sp.]|nr:YjfB family protein [Devosia sp.]
MEPADLASSLISMSAAKTQMSANIAVLKKQFEMQKAAVDMLLPAGPPAAPGTGLVVDKSA